MLLNEYYEGILLFDIMEKEVWNKASEDSVGQEKYYSANKANYMAGERARAEIYSSPTRSVIDQLKVKISAGDTTNIDEFLTTSKIRHESGLFEKEEKAILSKVSWSKGMFTADNSGVQYLVWIKTILAPGQKTFQEARPAVITDYQNYLEKNWIEQLKKKYPVKLNEKGKAYVFSQLQTR
jgi:peptidyl-prolyl cis-trans isomerase SurA